MPRAAPIALLACVLAACQPAARFRTEGAGSELYIAEMDASTANLRTYFNRLCDQADIALTGEPPACDTSGLTETQWRTVVFAGYNDIDARCDAYMNWLEAKRNERLFANQGLAALTGLLGGVLTGAGAANALGYVALALGFGGTVYNAYQDSLLMGLETSTIKTIVTERRLQFRAKFLDARFGSKPDAVFALRAYLRICTPATITMDVNTYSRDGVTGQLNGQASIQERQLQSERRSLRSYAPATAEQRATVVRPRGVPAFSGMEKITPEPGWTARQLRTLQAAFCVLNEEGGRIGPRTRANIDRFVSTRPDQRFDDYERIRAATADPTTGEATCDESRYRNYFENSNYRNAPAQEADLLKAMQALFPEDTAQAPTSFAAGRSLIGRARARCGLGNTGPFADQVTPDLETRLAGASNGKCGDTP